MAQVIINQAGPLPIDAHIETGSTGPAMLAFAGSVWSQQPNTMLSVDVLFEGSIVGTARIWSNGTTTHRALIPVHIPVDLDKPFVGDPATQPPTYNFGLRASNGATLSDQNDWFQVVLSI